ncbi:MAG TPA: Fic family protein [Dehalococcoidia bacterium]|nr:Fic family protein [Dehalococcoidia bacterium]
MPRWDVHFEFRLDADAPEVVRLLERAHALASVILAIPIPAPAADRIHALNIMRAVRGTTGIEGAELSEAEAQEIIATPREQTVLPATRSREEQEARNAHALMLFVAEALRAKPGLSLTETLICEIHDQITRGIDYPRNIPGHYRTHSVSAGSYIPPPSSDVPRLMGEFVRWFNDGPPSNWDLIIQALVAHFYVVSIHPFGDGNGRTARGVESLLLFKGMVNARGFYSLANYYYQHREEYVQHLDHVRFESGGDLMPFVLFGLRGLAAELQAVHNEVLQEVRRLAYRDYARSLLMADTSLSAPRRGRLILLAQMLVDDAISTDALLSGRADTGRLYRRLSEKTLVRDLAYLAQYGLVMVHRGQVSANMAVMDQFTPPHELLDRETA